ncbi:MAG: LLM class flavin-dependent oxidoreductase [Rhodospirillaceae bacterium]|nr:LLM class flavin-dependent oxidoreductase [Rhodospirillaceae bacterium]|tara:strand:- start:239 stop:1273 length:1035 start_codon:yes stop_codon:yes gene_type:complete
MTKLSVLDQSPIRSGATPADALSDTLALAEHVDRLGYHRYWLAEHHSSNGLAGAAPEIMIPQVAGRTHGIRVGSGGVMLSHYSPLKVAEAFRTIETLFPGRIDLGIGRAPGSDHITDQALQTGPGASGPEHYPVQVRDMMGYLAGSLPEDHPFANVRAQPAGPTVPDVWMLGSSDQSASLAAYFGVPFSFAHFIVAEGGPEAVAAYRENYRPSESWPEPIANIGVFAIAADTEDDAERLMKCRDLSSVRQRTGRAGPVPSVEEAETYEYTPQEEALRRYNRQRCIWGTGEQVRDGLLELGQLYDIDEFIVLTICPTLEARLRSYELLADAFELEARDVTASAAE